eukprot:6841533-Prymnesium_polylepis.1
MMRRKAVPERYAFLRCLCHESSCAIRVARVRQYKKRGAGSTLLRESSKGGGGAGPCGHGG